MLSTEEIEKRLGAKTVEAIEKAVTRGLADAQSTSNSTDGIEAMRYLLLSLLAAATVTPIDNARERAKQLGDDLVDLVEIALSSTTNQLN